MNPNHLTDALHDIDDDLLEEVDAVRNRPKTRRILPLVCRIGAAACMCLIIGIGAYHAFAPAPTADKDDPAYSLHSDTAFDIVGSTANGAPNYFYSAAEETTEAEDGSSRGDEFYLDPPLVDPTVDVDEEAYLTVSGTITAWSENGFSLLTIDGENLFITIDADTTFEVTDELTATFTNAPPTQYDMPVGTAVTVDADFDTLVAHHIHKGE